MGLKILISMRNLFRYTKKTKDAFIIMGVGLVLGLLYPTLNKGDNLGSVINGFIIGVVGSGFIVFNEVVLNVKFLRQLKFKALVLFKTVLYSVFFISIIPIVVSLTRSREQNTSFIEYVNGGGLHQFLFHEDFHIIIAYSLVSTAVFIFTYQMSKKMGQGVMWNFIIGKYHQTREEKRIFLFIDLNNSTTIAQNLGDIEYNKFLKQFYFDITDSIISNYGKIYRYVGDEVVISWRMKKGLENTNCINTYFQAKSALEKKREYYMNHFGFAPSFSAGYNYGKVIVGEIGDIKSQISFIGKVMYNTAAIEKYCKKYDTNILIADKLLKHLKLSSNYNIIKKGEVEITNSTPIPVSSINLK